MSSHCLPLTSVDPIAARAASFGQLFPEALTDGRPDAAKLAALLGGIAASAAERYGLNWAGKGDALKALRQLTTATLLPAPTESEKWDVTGNTIIEGDNLEVLKVLQHAYHGKVKIIYIDPPYNTGGDFIYPDDYSEGLSSYLQFTRQASEGGVKLTTNVNTSGRYHSRWLTMIYPRLFLARNLLREDGVIFVSIDDHEVHNLRLVMNEIFGEENFVATFVWEKKRKASNLDSQVRGITEYVLAYRRRLSVPLSATEDVPEANKPYPFYNTGNVRKRLQFPPGFVSTSMQDGEYAAGRYEDQKTYVDLIETIRVVNGIVASPMILEGEWRYSQKALDEMVARGERVVLKGTKLKPYWINNSDREKFVRTLLTKQNYNVGTNEDGNAELAALFEEDVFPFSKPSSLIRKLIELVGDDEAVILDFFAGSGTTAQAVLELNAEDGGNRTFILVQLPEPTGRKDFPTIAEITKERVRRVIKKLSAEAKSVEKKQRKCSSERSSSGLADPVVKDLGFKVFKLAPSNFAVWDPALAAAEPDGLAKQWELTADNVRGDASEQALLHELMLKSGLPLTTPIIPATAGGTSVYQLDGDKLLVCLVRELTRDALRAMIDLKPRAVLCLDIAFKGNDALKVNAQLEFQSHQIQFRTA
jgi:adenine-specific DNA-methyltransferase